MNGKRKMIFTMLCCALSMMFFASCGNGDTVQTGDNTSGDTTVSETVDADTVTDTAEETTADETTVEETTVEETEPEEFAFRIASEIEESDKLKGWRLNTDSVVFADPLLFDDTERSGFYYIYGSGFICSRSKDLENWEYLGNFIQREGRLAEWTCTWAPEVIYDDDTEKYYAFYSMEPTADDEYDVNDKALSGYFGMMAVSDSAAGPFIPVDFTSEEMCGAENVRERDTALYPQYYADYALLDPGQYVAAIEATGLKPFADNAIYRMSKTVIVDDHLSGKYVGTIDFTPYVDPDTGEKYLFWSQVSGCIAGLKMKNWFTPDWSTFQMLIFDRFYEVEDYAKYIEKRSSVTLNEYETSLSYVTEGPFVYKHNEKYYITCSVGSYTDIRYSVIQAVADSPLGPYRKLTEAENGILLSNDYGENIIVGGTGHHSFATINIGGEEKIIMAYHVHDDTLNGVYTRHTQFDEVKWITIDDINGQPLDVMYINGPSITPQPSFGINGNGDISSSIESVEVVSGSENVANAEALIDGFVSYNTTANADFNVKYIKETEISGTATFSLKLNSARMVRGIMFYNSKDNAKRLSSIKNVELICEENGENVTYTIDEIPINESTAVYFGKGAEDYSNGKTVPGSGLFADFTPENVIEIRFTVEMDELNLAKAISEVAIIGKIN